MRQPSSQHPPALAECRWEGFCADAVEILERALEQPPAELKKQVHQVEKAVVRLRNELIEHLRLHPDSPHAEQWRDALNHVNPILSLIIGVEFPLGSLQQEFLVEARDALQELVQEEAS